MSSELAKLPPGGSIVFHVHMEAKSIEASNQLVEHLLAVKETAKTSEPGTLTFRICRFEEKLMLLEEYEDEKALQAHLESAAFKTFMAAAPSLSTGPPDLSYYREEL
ncbi:hypothetical protein FRC04_009446 [Tulasnella sp. 424]|nr:hypothetical protein FRC04_009446 [Tulasnella sp. 424]KAG8971899.1 hypothetical protein FRC05_010568 [Tulasnella sp. 425]